MNRTSRWVVGVGARRSRRCTRSGAHPAGGRRGALALLALSLLPACADRPGAADAGGPEMDHGALAPVALAGVVVHDSDRLGLPRALAVVGEHLVVIDAAADSVVHLFRREDGEYLRSFGTRGGGPGEYRGAWSIVPVSGSTREFWVYDLGARRLTHVDLDRDFEPGAKRGDRSVNLVADATILDPVWLDSAVVAAGFFTRGRFARFDRRGAMVEVFGELPPGEDAIPANVRQHAYQSTMVPNPDRSRLALVSRHADRVEIYGVDGRLLAQAERPFGFEPVYEVGERGDQPALVTGDDLRFGYIAAAATSDRIFALFSGRTRRGFPGQANFGEYVHVFDWNGVRRAILKLDAPALAIAVDEATSALYAIRHLPRPAIVRYDYARALGSDR